MNAMLPAHLSETLNNLGDAARALTDEVRTESERREAEAQAAVAAARRQNRFVLALLTVVAVLVAFLLTVVVQNRLRSNQNSEILRQTALTSARIADCTTVGGACYEQGVARQSDAIRTLVRAIIYVAPCSQITDTDEELEDCVMRRLLESSPAPGVTPAPGASVTPAPTPQPAPSD